MEIKNPLQSKEYYYAGFWWRVLATYIDNLIIQVAIGIGLKLTPFQQRLKSYLETAAQPAAGAKKHLSWTQLVEQTRINMEIMFNRFISDRAMIEGFIVLTIICYFAIWLYRALMESSPVQSTLGKKVCGLVVTDMQGNRISFGRASGRCGVRFGISALCSAFLWIYFFRTGFNADTLLTVRFWSMVCCVTFVAGIAYFLAGWTPRKQTLHDIIAGTLVFRRRSSPQVEPPPQLI